MKTHWSKMKWRRGTDPDEHAGIAVELTPGDLWIGAFVRQSNYTYYVTNDVYLILIPCLVLHLWWSKDTSEPKT